MPIRPHLPALLLALLLVPACGLGDFPTFSFPGPVRKAGSALSDRAVDVACHVDGCISVTGTFEGTATFGAGRTATTLSASGQRDVFVARYDAAMELVWVVHGSGPTFADSYAIAAGPAGSCVVVGDFDDQITFTGSNGFVTQTSTGPTDRDGFVVSILADGSLSWTDHIHGADYQSARGVGFAPDTRLYVTGSMSGTTVIGDNHPGEETLLSFSEKTDMFLACYGGDGLILWATQAGGVMDDAGKAVVADPAGGAVVVGGQNDSAVFGLLEPNATVLSTMGSNAMFVARFANDGSLVWAKGASGTLPIFATDVALLSDGSAALTGSFQGAATFGAGTPQQTTMSASGTLDLYLARYLPDGTLSWAEQAGGDEYVFGNGIAVAPGDALYVTGGVEGTATFGAGQPAQTTLGAGLFSDIYLARYDSNGSLDWVRSAGGGAIDTAHGVAHTFSGGAAVVGSFSMTATWGAGALDVATLTAEGGQDAFVARYDPNGYLD